MEEQKKIEKDIDHNINYLKDFLGVGESFDIIFREYKIGRKRAASFSINAMTNDILLTNVIEDMLTLHPDELTINTLQKLFYTRVTHSQVKLMGNMNDAVTSLLSGELLFLVDGEEEIIIIDARSYPARMPSESTIEKVTRGSRDSFVETLVFNTALIRRRLRDPQLRFEIVKIGTRSQGDIAVAYIKDITDPKLVDIVKERLNSINIDGIPMAEKAIEEFIVGGSKWNPLPKVRYTERPDVAAVHLLEGHVCLVIDTSPNIMILPTTFWHHVQHVEEFHQHVVVGSYLRMVRLLGVFLSLLLPPLWLALVLQRHLLPESLAFLGPRDPGIIPLGFQFILAELGVELVRMATVHVPSAQSTALGFIGAFMIGEFATKVGLFGNEIIFYTAVAAVGAFATPSIEFAMAIRFFRAILLLLVIFFKLPGLLVGLVGIFIVMATTKSFGIPYLWPLLPFNLGGMKDVLLRLPLPSKILRPAALKPQDKDRLDNEDEEKNKNGK
ncbi:MULTISPECIES: spore germination protein [Pelosinus]|uniref:GerA spore germination protein n=1 Tax=Pelosinus fermentans B4 TaxID=1149862 RepID=I9LDF3_9FIRM|nr:MULTISPECIES: spore germination protein [Pelosinus]EIW18469.1 GerA spore germination protein [Pelosinus fermentans B4]EIW24483.1 GerA spore germination protein [Pelosinus fermentans A11]OAM94459.1 GerA spore germination protein [Pelosinus fermentans DSM 17108]SDR09672.1 stage V sporulation protein AF [Pelosinus fermentans]